MEKIANIIINLIGFGSILILFLWGVFGFIYFILLII